MNSDQPDSSPQFVRKDDHHSTMSRILAGKRFLRGMLARMTAIEVARNGSKVRQDVVSPRNPLMVSSVGIPDDATTLVDSTLGVAASAVATLATAATEQAWLSKVIVSGLGATAAGASKLTIAGCEGEDIVVSIPIPAGATLAITPFVLSFEPALRAAVGDDITATITSFGTGNTESQVTAIGWKVAAQS